MNMTHPDILEMENKGYIGQLPKAVGYCIVCKEEIYKGESVFKRPDAEDGYICENCNLDYMKRFRTVAV